MEICGWPLAKTTPTATHRFPQRWKSVEICGNLWVAFSQDYIHSHPQISTTVGICGNLWVAFSQDYTHSHPQISTTVEICGLMWVIFDLSILFPVRPMLGHMMLFALMSFGDLNQAHVGHARSLARSSRSPFVLSSLLLLKKQRSSYYVYMILLFVSMISVE